MILPPINSANIRPNLPVITGVSAPKVQIGEYIREIPVKQALKMIDYVNSLPSSLSGLISEVNISNPGDMVIYTVDEGIKIHLGDGEYIDKITFLKAVLNDVRIRNISVKYLDMRYKDQIIVARDNK
jgi:cell division protein FtsQ